VLRGTHQDHGEVGYAPDPHAQYLLFPRSLRRFEDRRVIGINYDLLVPETTSGAPRSVAPKRPPGRVPEKKKPITETAAPAKSNVVHFPADHPAPEKAPAEKPPSKKRTPDKKPAAAPSHSHPASPPLDRVTAGEIRRAVNELKTGKYVAAYTRLSALLQPRP
jgi:hypothetical protein